MTTNKRTMNDPLPLTHLNAKTQLSGPMFKNVARLLDGRVSTSANPDGKCKGFFDCTNDAIGVVSRDPYDHVSWSPVVPPRAYCLNCYNERLLAALDFIRREKVQ